MTDETLRQPVVTALHKFLRQDPDGDAPIQVFSYHEKEDFKKLWSFEVLLDKEPHRTAKPFLIFWKGFPSEDARGEATPADRGEFARTAVNKFVTPYHWALALAQWCQSQTPARQVPRVWVLHAIPTANYEIWDQLGARCRSMRAHLPWLRGVSLAGSASTAYKDSDAIYRNCFLEPIDKILSESKHLQLDSPPLPEALVDALRNQFTGDPEGHHSIANLVGPVLLARCLGVSEEIASGVTGSPQREALISLLTHFGWIDNSKPKTTSFANEVYRGELDPRDSRKSVRYWLVDDQASLGYAAILSAALDATECEVSNPSSEVGGLPEGKSVQWSSGPGPILAKLKQQRIADWLEPRVIADVDVLFLDLRLWLGRPRTPTEHPLAAIVEVAKVLLEVRDDGSRVAPDGDEYVLQAFSEAKKLVEASDAHAKSPKRDGDTYATELAAITLLPLLLSHYDPSLPIIVFSSTRQREVAKRLQHRPNIHLQFAKPGIGDQAANSTTTRGDFADAVRAALRQHQLRFVWRRIEELDLTQESASWATGSGPIHRATKSTNCRLSNRPLSKALVFKYGLRVRLPDDRSASPYKPAIWNLNRAETQQRLAGLYMQLLEGEFNSLMSGCYELMEAAFSTVEQKREFASIELVWPRHWNIRPDKDDQRLFRFSLLAVALQKIRNLKAHGLNLHADPHHEEAYAHLACAALLIALLDFLEQKVDGDLVGFPEPATLVNGNESHFPHFTNRNLRPWDLAKLNGRCATDTAYIFYALSSALYIVREPGGVRLPPSMNFASKDLVDLCAAFATQKDSMGDAKKKPEPHSKSEPGPGGVPRREDDIDDDIASMPIKLVGCSEDAPDTTYVQFAIPFRYRLREDSFGTADASRGFTWEPLTDGIAKGVDTLNRDAKRAFDPGEFVGGKWVPGNAEFFRLTGADTSSAFNWSFRDTKARDKSVSYRLSRTELLLFAPDARDEKNENAQRLGLLILEVDFLGDSHLTFDDVLEFNATTRKTIHNYLAKSEGGLWTLTTSDILPGKQSGDILPGERTADGLAKIALLQLPLIKPNKSRILRLPGDRSQVLLSSDAYVHSVVTIAGENRGIVALYEDVRNECGELGEDELPPKGAPQECADLYRLLTIEGPDRIPKRNDPFTQDWLATRMYNRSASSGVCYAFDYNSACLVVGDNEAGKVYAEHARTKYFVQWLHLLYMRAAISAFSENLSNLTRDARDTKGFDLLHQELQQFENVNNFPFISDDGHSRDLYPKARAAMDLNDYLEELDKEVRLTTEYHNRRLVERLSKRSFYFSQVATCFAVIALLFGFLGINLLDEDTLCSMQRGLGDQGTSYCEKSLKGKLQAILANDLTEAEGKKLDRLSYDMICPAVGKVTEAFSEFGAQRKVTQVAKDECNRLSVVWWSAWVEWCKGSSRWVFWSGLAGAFAVVGLLVYFLYSLFRRFRPASE